MKRAAVWSAAGAVILAAAAAGALTQRSRNPAAQGPSGAGGSPAPARGGNPSDLATARGEIESLRKENAALKRRLAEVEEPAASGAAALAPVPGAAGPQTVPVNRLLAKARDAIQAEDAQAFADAFCALLDAGEPAYAAVIVLEQELGDKPRLFQNPGNQEALQKFYIGVMARAPKLGGLVDAVLAREGAPDHATQFALQLMQAGAQSRMPRERQVALLLSLTTPSDDPADRSSYFAWSVLMGKLKAVEALPTIEKRFAEASDQETWVLLSAIGSLGGPEALASLKQLLGKQASPYGRRGLIHALGRNEGKEVNDLLWEMMDKEGDASTRAQVLQTLAGRPENRDRILQQLRSAPLSQQDQDEMLNGLMNAAQQDKDLNKTLWDLYETEPTLRDAVLGRMLGRRDARAAGVLGERLKTGQITDTLAGSLPNLDTKAVRANADSLRSLAADMAAKVRTRGYAYAALVKVDRQGALDALLTGFSRLSEQDRIQVVGFADGWGRSGPEARAELSRIAANDPSEQVRAAAARFSKDR